MTFLICEPDDLILDGRAIPWSHPFDSAGIHCRAVKVLSDELGGLVSCVRDITGKLSSVALQDRARREHLPPSPSILTLLFHVEQSAPPIAKVRDWIVSVLDFHLGEINRRPQQSWGRSGLQPP